MFESLEDLLARADKGFERHASNEHCIGLDDDIAEKLEGYLINGRPKGTTTYYKSIDPHWKWRLGEYNIWSGYNNEGKTTLLNELCICKAIAEGTKFAMFSPENMPREDFYGELAEVYTGKSLDKDRGNVMTLKELKDAEAFLREHFHLVYPTKANFTMQNIENGFEWYVANRGVQVCIVDPYMKVRSDQRSSEGEHNYIARFLAERIDFCRTTNISYHLVAHQTTPTKDQEGNYPDPDLYKIKGGGSFADGADNVLMVSRPWRGSDSSSTAANFTSKKIKKQKLVGHPGTARLDYDRRSGRYYEMDPKTEQEMMVNDHAFDWRQADLRMNVYSPLALLRNQKAEADEPRVYGMHFSGNGMADFEANTARSKSDEPPF